jgi:DNA-binding transcriptional MerR regulator
MDENMPENLSVQAIIQNLKDAGCDLETIERFLSFEKSGSMQQQRNLLSVHRDHLLEKVHREERKIDCLDYLVYQLSKKWKHTEVCAGHQPAVGDRKKWKHTEVCAGHQPAVGDSKSRRKNDGVH